MNLIENIAGEICRIILPINEEVFFGNSRSSLALCTLSSVKLLKEISNSSLMSRIAIAGRLLSENNGIDSLVRHVISHQNIKTILICGKDASGHRPGDSLLALYKNGIDLEGRIIGSSSPNAVLTVTKLQTDMFRKQVELIDEIGQTSMAKIKVLIDSID